MRFSTWLFGKTEVGKEGQNDRIPDFKKIFVSLPNIVEAMIIQTKDDKQEDVPSAQERDRVKNVADKELKAASSKVKVKDVRTRIQTAMRRNKQIVWLLRMDKDIPCKSLRDLIVSHGSAKDSNLYRGMSVNFVSGGALYEISPLTEQDLEGLVEKPDFVKSSLR